MFKCGRVYAWRGVSNSVVCMSWSHMGVSQFELFTDISYRMWLTQSKWSLYVGRFYFKQQDLKETCTFRFLLANQNVCQRSTPLSRSLESPGCRRRSTGPFFHPSKFLFSPSFFTVFHSRQLFFCFSPGKAELGLWMENVNEAFRLNAPGWGSVPCDPTSARRRKKTLRSTTPAQQWTSIEKQQHQNSQMALIGERLKRMHGSDSQKLSRRRAACQTHHVGL